MIDPAASPGTATRGQIVLELSGLVAGLLRLEGPEAVREDSRLVEDLGMDSLAMVDLITLVEEHWKVRLASSTDLTAIETVGAVADMLAETLAKPSAD